MYNSYQGGGITTGRNYAEKNGNKFNMDNLIQTLLDGYDTPVFLSDADQGEIMFVNHAAEQKLGFSKTKVKGTRINDWVQRDTMIWHQPIMEHGDSFYMVQNENFTFSGTKFIKYTFKPFSERAALSYFNLQQEMASRIVHRMRSPLTGVLGFAELLEETSLDDQQLRYVNAVEEGLDDLESVLSELKVLGEDIAVQKRNVDVRLLMEQVIESLPAELAGRVSLTIDTQVEHIETSFILLKAIIEEVLVNAFEHGAGGRTPVHIHWGEKQIRIHNEGEPIPESLTPYIFYPFFSGKARTMGIGLAKCAHYAHELGIGLNLAENSIEKGISFDIILAGSRSSD